MANLEARITKLESRPMTEAELAAESERLSRLYRDDPGMKAVINRIASDTPESTLAAAILAGRKRAGMRGQE